MSSATNSDGGTNHPEVGALICQICQDSAPGKNPCNLPRLNNGGLQAHLIEKHGMDRSICTHEIRQSFIAALREWGYPQETLWDDWGCESFRHLNQNTGYLMAGPHLRFHDLYPGYKPVHPDPVPLPDHLPLPSGRILQPFTPIPAPIVNNSPAFPSGGFQSTPELNNQGFASSPNTPSVTAPSPTLTAGSSLSPTLAAVSSLGASTSPAQERTFSCKMCTKAMPGISFPQMNKASLQEHGRTFHNLKEHDLEGLFPEGDFTCQKCAGFLPAAMLPKFDMEQLEAHGREFHGLRDDQVQEFRSLSVVAVLKSKGFGKDTNHRDASRTATTQVPGQSAANGHNSAAITSPIAPQVAGDVDAAHNFGTAQTLITAPAVRVVVNPPPPKSTAPSRRKNKDGYTATKGYTCHLCTAANRWKKQTPMNLPQLMAHGRQKHHIGQEQLEAYFSDAVSKLFSVHYKSINKQALDSMLAETSCARMIHRGRVKTSPRIQQRPLVHTPPLAQGDFSIISNVQQVSQTPAPSQQVFSQNLPLPQKRRKTRTAARRSKVNHATALNAQQAQTAPTRSDAEATPAPVIPQDSEPTADNDLLEMLKAYLKKDDTLPDQTADSVPEVPVTNASPTTSEVSMITSDLSQLEESHNFSDFWGQELFGALDPVLDGSAALPEQGTDSNQQGSFANASPTANGLAAITLDNSQPTESYEFPDSWEQEFFGGVDPILDGSTAFSEHGTDSNQEVSSANASPTTTAPAAVTSDSLQTAESHDFPYSWEQELFGVSDPILDGSAAFSEQDTGSNQQASSANAIPAEAVSLIANTPSSQEEVVEHPGDVEMSQLVADAVKYITDQVDSTTQKVSLADASPAENESALLIADIGTLQEKVVDIPGDVEMSQLVAAPTTDQEDSTDQEEVSADNASTQGEQVPSLADISKPTEQDIEIPAQPEEVDDPSKDRDDGQFEEGRDDHSDDKDDGQTGAEDDNDGGMEILWVGGMYAGEIPRKLSARKSTGGKMITEHAQHYAEESDDSVVVRSQYAGKRLPGQSAGDKYAGKRLPGQSARKSIGGKSIPGCSLPKDAIRKWHFDVEEVPSDDEEDDESHEESAPDGEGPATNHCEDDIEEVESDEEDSQSDDEYAESIESVESDDEYENTPVRKGPVGKNKRQREEEEGVDVLLGLPALKKVAI